MGTDDSQPLVSVILPFFNAPFLKEAIESILRQSYSSYELILIDNGSSDQSKEIAKSYAEVEKIRLVSEPQRGVVYAANRGVAEARGTFIARMDADDVSKSNRLEEQVNMLLSDSSLGVVSGLVEYKGSSANEGFIQYVDWLNSILSAKDIYLNQFVEFPLANPTLMFRKSLFEEHGGYKEGDFPEDYEFFLSLQAANVQMSKVNETVIEWRDTETRLTRTDPRYSQDAFFRIKAQYLAKWLSKHNPLHPKVYIWGAGRLSRRRSDYLLEEGIEVAKYVDLKESERTMHYESLPGSAEAFVVSYVGNRGARDEIRSFLNNQGFQEGINYIVAS